MYDHQVMNENGSYLLKMQLSLFYNVFTLCKLTSYSTGLLQVSNDVKLFMADAAY
jgi:hypothetical protein